VGDCDHIVAPMDDWPPYRIVRHLGSCIFFATRVSMLRNRQYQTRREDGLWKHGLTIMVASSSQGNNLNSIGVAKTLLKSML
jgi:hypothetical protein